MINIIRKIRVALSPDIKQADLVTRLKNISRKYNNFQRIQSFIDLMKWIALPVTEDELHSRDVRFKFLIQFLERNPNEAQNFFEFIEDFTQRGQSIRLLSLIGVSENSGFFSEFHERLSQKFLPATSMEEDLATIFQQSFQSQVDADWILRSAEKVIAPFLKLINAHGISADGIKGDLKDAMIIVTSQIASIGTHREIRRRLEITNLGQSNFIKLGTLILSGETQPDTILNTIDNCRKHIQHIRNGLEATGVSVHLIYQIEKLSALLDRLEMLIFLQTPESMTNRYQLYAEFASGLIKVDIKRHGIREFLNSHLHLITRKVVERAGEKGDFYIATNAEERTHLFNAGAWAGVLTSFAALFKSVIGYGEFPPLITSFFYFLNYSLIFLLMQKWHLALSSKLPAYTAAALSKQLEVFKQTRRILPIVQEVRTIFNSQMIAATGNVIWVVAVCLIIDWLWFFSTGHHLMNHHEAIYTIKSHDLLSSATVWYAFLTGIFLWISSLVAGWVENWLVFNKFPNFIRNNYLLNAIFDKKTLDEWAENSPSILGPAAGNLMISALLAFPIVFGKITGLPIDIRHVTLSTGSITFAFNSLRWSLEYWPMMISMLLSIIVMASLNFGVSFYCSLKLAASSQNIEKRHFRMIVKYFFMKR